MVFSQSIGKWQTIGEVGREISKIAKTHYLAYLSSRLLFPHAVVNPGISRPQLAAVGREEHFPQPGDDKSLPRCLQVWNGGFLKHLSEAAVSEPPSDILHGKNWGTVLHHLRGMRSTHLWGLLTKLNKKVQEHRKHSKTTREREFR